MKNVTACCGHIPHNMFAKKLFPEFVCPISISPRFFGSVLKVQFDNSWSSVPSDISFSVATIISNSLSTCIPRVSQSAYFINVTLSVIMYWILNIYFFICSSWELWSHICKSCKVVDARRYVS